MTELSTTTKEVTLKGLLSSPAYKQRFDEMLGKKSQSFISSIITLASQDHLKTCEPVSIIGSAVIAATLDLPINQNLGFAYIVPYKKDGQQFAQFQMGWRGYVQLAMRTGQYQTITVNEVYEGELKVINKFSEQFEFGQAKSNKIVGYIAYLKLLNGFEKYLYMTVEELEAHGKKFSKTYDFGPWKKDFSGMAKKTVLKLLLSKFGFLSIDMQNMATAIESDQAVYDENGLRYADNPGDESNSINIVEVINKAKITESSPVKPKAQESSPKSSPQQYSLVLQEAIEKLNSSSNIDQLKGFHFIINGEKWTPEESAIIEAEFTRLKATFPAKN